MSDEEGPDVEAVERLPGRTKEKKKIEKDSLAERARARQGRVSFLQSASGTLPRGPIKTSTRGESPGKVEKEEYKREGLKRASGTSGSPSPRIPQGRDRNGERCVQTRRSWHEQ
jgi:hypothetical protein